MALTVAVVVGTGPLGVAEGVLLGFLLGVNEGGVVEGAYECFAEGL